MITKNPIWKQIRLGLKEHVRSEKLTADIMRRIKELKDEDNQVTTTENN
jgi:hypothetical protein